MQIEGTSTLISKGTRNIQTIVNKVRNGNDYFRTEFSKNDFCPKAKTVKECEWLGQ